MAAESARAQLGQYPNVTGVGVGTKQIAGAHTESWCISVLVSKKVPASELAPAEQIPDQIDGVPTDVIEVGEMRGLDIDPVDHLETYDATTYRPLRGGIKLGFAYPSIFGTQPDTPHAGTLGCVVLSKSIPSRHLALTNWHVIQTLLPHGPVGQPHDQADSTCCSSNNIIGNVSDYAHDTVDPTSENIFPVDAAVCALNTGLEWVAGVAPAGRGTSVPAEPINGIRDLRPSTTPSLPPNLMVHKRGQATGLTTGTVTGNAYSTAQTVGTRSFNGLQLTTHIGTVYYLTMPVMMVQAASPGPRVTITAVTNANPCQITAPGNTFAPGDTVQIANVVGMTELNSKSYLVGNVNRAAGTFTISSLDGTPVNSSTFGAYGSGGTVTAFSPFSSDGDSGSLVMDSSGNVVGLLCGSNLGTTTQPAGLIGLICHIQPVLDALNVTVPTTGSFPGPQTVPANNNPYAAITSVADPRNTIAQVQSDLMATAHGIVVARALMAHQREVRTLVQTNPRVAAVWRHVAGPDMVQRLLAAVRDHDLPIVPHNPDTARTHLARLVGMLKRYGSTALRDDVRRFGDTLIDMVGLTYREFLARLDAPSAPEQGQRLE
jgi:hypothetical protein